MRNWFVMLDQAPAKNMPVREGVNYVRISTGKEHANARGGDEVEQASAKNMPMRNKKRKKNASLHRKENELVEELDKGKQS